MINAGGILGQLTISATAWQAGLAQATQSLQQFTQTTQQLTQQLNGTLNQVAAATQNVQQQLQRATTAAQAHAPAVRTAGEAHREFSSYVTRATSDLGTFISTALRWSILANTIGQVTRLVDNAFQGVADVTVGFNSILQASSQRWENLLGSMEKAQVFMARIQQEAVKTPFDFEHLDRGLARLAAAGVAINDLISLNHDLGNALAYSGNQTNEAYDRAIKALSNMQTSIRVNTREMNEFTRLGIPAWEILANHVGVTTGQIRKMVEEGQVNVTTFRAAFHEWVTTDVGDIMDKQSKNFLVALSNIRDGLRFTFGQVFNPVFQRLNDLANRGQEFAQSRDFQEWGNHVAAVMEIVMQAATSLAQVFVTVFTTILETVATVGKLVYDALQWLNPFAHHSKSLVESVTEGVATIIERYQSLAAVGDTLTSIGERVEAFRRISEGTGQISLDKQLREVSVLGQDVASAYGAAFAAIQEAQPVLADLNRQVADQKEVVRETKGELDAYQETLHGIDDRIRELEISGRDYRETLEGLKDQLLPARAALDEATGAMEAQRDRAQAATDALDPLRTAYENITATVTRTRDALSDAKDEMNGFLNAPIAGERAFQNKLSGFQTQLAQLDAQIAQIEAKPGAPSTSDRAQLERLRGQEAQLRAQERQLRAQRQVDILPITQAREEARRGPEMAPGDIQAGLARTAPQVNSLEQTLKSQIESARSAKEALDAGTQHARAVELAAHQQELVVQARQRDVHAVEREITAAQNAYEQAILRPIERLREERHEVELTHSEIQTRYEDEKRKLDDLVSGTQAVKSAVRDWQSALDAVAQSARTAIAEQKRAELEARRQAAEDALNAAGDPNKHGFTPTGEELEDLKRRKEEFDTAVADMQAKLQPLFSFLQRLQAFAEEPLGRALTALATTLLLVRGAAMLTGFAVGAILSPLGLVALAVITLSEVWNRNFGQIQQITQELVDGPFKVLGQAMSALSQGDLETFKTLFQAGMKDLGTKIREDLGYWASNFLTWATEMAPPVLERLGDFAVKLIGWIVEQADVIYQKLTEEWIPAFTNWLQQPETGVIPRIGKLLVVLLDKLDTWTRDHQGDIEDFFNRWTERLLAFIGHAIDVVASRLIEFVDNIDTWEQTEGGKRMDDIGRRLGQAVVEGLSKGLARGTYAFGNWIRGLFGLQPLPVPQGYMPGAHAPRSAAEATQQGLPTAGVTAPNIPALTPTEQAASDAASEALDLARQGASPTHLPNPDITQTAFEMNRAAVMQRIAREWEEVSLRATQQHNAYEMQLRFDVANGRVVSGDLGELLSRGKMPGKKLGGGASGRFIVGEEGPEVVDLPAGSFVHPSGTPMPPELPSSIFAGVAERFGRLGSGIQAPVPVTIDTGSIMQIGELVGNGVAATQQTVASTTPQAGWPPMEHGLLHPGESYSVYGRKVTPGDDPYSNPWLGREAELARMAGGDTYHIETHLHAGLIFDQKRDIASAIGHEASSAIRDSQRMGG